MVTNRKSELKKVKRGSQLKLQLCNVLLGAFAKCRKITVSFVVYALPSILMEQLGSHWTDFHEIWFDVCVIVHHLYNNINNQLDATTTVY